jgi:hypothetical protein
MTAGNIYPTDKTTTESWCQPMVESRPKIEPNRSAERSAFISGTISREARAAEGFPRSQGWNGQPQKQADLSLRLLGPFRSACFPMGGSGTIQRAPRPPRQKIFRRGRFWIVRYSATVGRTTGLRTISHTRLSYRCVGAGTSHPCRSRVSAASIALCLFRMDEGPWLEISRLLMVFLGQCCISQSSNFCAGSLCGCLIAASVGGRALLSLSKIVVTANVLPGWG